MASEINDQIDGLEWGASAANKALQRRLNPGEKHG